MINSTKTISLATALLLCIQAAASLALAQEVHIPNLSYRTGPFATTGIPVMNGQRDYIYMLNERDGGLNGLKLIFEECETGYNTDKGMECYEKTKGNAVITQPWSTGITLQVLPRTNVDHIPILAAGYGFSPMSNGNVFAWAFNPPSSYWDAASMILNYVGEGDLEMLRGQKIAYLHLDHPYGKEPVPLFELLAERHGFEFVTIPVGLKEMQNQSAQWLQIRRENPDWVFMWGLGAMNTSALTEAVKTRFPMDRFIGIWWSGHDWEMKAAGEKAKGYKSISWNVPGHYPIIDEVKKYVVDRGNSLIEDESELYTVFYQRGLIITMILVEGIRVAQKEFNTVEVSPVQLRWGLENLDISEERLQELGMSGMTTPFKTSCDDHTGHGGGWMLEWDGGKFVRVSDHILPDRELIKPFELEKAEEYAQSNAPWPYRNDFPCNLLCSSPGNC